VRSPEDVRLLTECRTCHCGYRTCPHIRNELQTAIPGVAPGGPAGSTWSRRRFDLPHDRRVEVVGVRWLSVRGLVLVYTRQWLLRVHVTGRCVNSCNYESRRGRPAGALARHENHIPAT
jgi:hypothetical protein